MAIIPDAVMNAFDERAGRLPFLLDGFRLFGERAMKAEHLAAAGIVLMFHRRGLRRFRVAWVLTFCRARKSQPLITTAETIMVAPISSMR